MAGRSSGTCKLYANGTSPTSVPSSPGWKAQEPREVMNEGARHIWGNLPSKRQVGTQVMASGAGSIVVGLILTPIQVLKVRWQMVSGQPTAAGATTNVAGLRGQMGVVSLAQTIFREEGLLAFWRGFGTMIVMQAPSTAVYMVCYEALKGLIHQTLPANSTTQKYMTPVVAGSLGRSVTATIFAPLELVRTNQAAGRGGNLYDTTLMILRNRGVPGLYAGLLPTLYRDVPFSALYWLAFEEGKKALVRSRLPGMVTSPVLDDSGSGNFQTDDRFLPQPSTLAVFLSAACAGTLAAVVTHPFDNIKTRMQVAVTDQTMSKGARLESLTASVVWREMGPAIFFRGLGLRLMQIIPGTSSMMMTYSLVKRAFGESV